MRVRRYNNGCLRITNELLRDLIEPAFTLWHYYVMFVCLSVEFGILIYWPPNTTITWFLTWLAIWLLFIASYYLNLYTLNAEGASIKTY